MKTIWPVLLMAAWAVGCASAGKPFDPTTMVMGSPDDSAEYREAYSLKDLEELRPQLRFPITLAVSQPSSGDGWSAAEVELIASWEPALKASGLVESLVILPESLSTTCGWRMSYHCGVKGVRRTAARFHADAVLYMAAQTEVRQWVNPLSILNITVVGLWLAPGHHRSAVSVLEGSLIDNRNEYLYAFARATGEAKMVRPMVYADRYEVSRSSRLRALEEFGRLMIDQIGDYAKEGFMGSEAARKHGEYPAGAERVVSEDRCIGPPGPYGSPSSMR